ncbi:hypothetical protein FISHEDRAFT_57189 [Fistulina hepatica ATCC 64428]|nr:hypothetical protein FISHEDRAFT_57189 [Fistulina hepatica ATCC 64428]
MRFPSFYSNKLKQDTNGYFRDFAQIGLAVSGSWSSGVGLDGYREQTSRDVNQKAEAALTPTCVAAEFRAWNAAYCVRRASTRRCNAGDISYTKDTNQDSLLAQHAARCAALQCRKDNKAGAQDRVPWLHARISQTCVPTHGEERVKGKHEFNEGTSERSTQQTVFREGRTFHEDIACANHYFGCKGYEIEFQPENQFKRKRPNSNNMVQLPRSVDPEQHEKQYEVRYRVGG